MRLDSPSDVGYFLSRGLRRIHHSTVLWGPLYPRARRPRRAVHRRRSQTATVAPLPIRYCDVELSNDGVDAHGRPVLGTVTRTVIRGDVAFLDGKIFVASGQSEHLAPTTRASRKFGTGAADAPAVVATWPLRASPSQSRSRLLGCAAYCANGCVDPDRSDCLFGLLLRLVRDYFLQPPRPQRCP